MQVRSAFLSLWMQHCLILLCCLRLLCRLMYDRAAEFWQLLYQVFTPLLAYEDSKKRTKIVGQMWSSHQRFFRQMLMAAKVPSCAKIALDAVENSGQCVVIGLQSTGEANMNAVSWWHGLPATNSVIPCCAGHCDVTISTNLWWFMDHITTHICLQWLDRLQYLAIKLALLHMPCSSA